MIRDYAARSMSSTVLPYLPKVIPISDDGLRRLYRWQDPEPGQEPHDDESVADVAASMVVNLNPKIHRGPRFKPLAGRSGWAAFRLLAVKTAPRIRYLLYAAITSEGDWADAMTIESLFDCAVFSDAYDRMPACLRSQLDYGLDCHRQLSLAAWQNERKAMVAELEDDLGRRYNQRAEDTEKRLNAVRESMRVERSPEVRKVLAEDRAHLRTALLDAEATEGEVARFLLRLNAQQPEYESQTILTLAWAIAPAARHFTKSSTRKS